jgi:hypothetical protein
MPSSAYSCACTGTPVQGSTDVRSSGLAAEIDEALGGILLRGEGEDHAGTTVSRAKQPFPLVVIWKA